MCQIKFFIGKKFLIEMKLRSLCRDSKRSSSSKATLRKYNFPNSKVPHQLYQSRIDFVLRISKQTDIYLSHFASACKMRYPLNLVLEN